jgi:P-type Ca2+ transporter type 2C
MNGLSTAEATARLSRIGPNALPEQPPVPLWRRFVRQFQSPLIYILLFALAFDLGLWFYEGAHAWPIEATAIGLILLFNAALGLYQEQRSEAALTRLKALAWSPGMGTPRWPTRPSHDACPGSKRLGAPRSGRPRPSRRDAHGRSRRHAG